MAIELYKYKHGLSPVIMNEIFLDKKCSGGPKLRSKTEFCIPRVNTVYKGDDFKAFRTIYMGNSPR